MDNRARRLHQELQKWTESPLPNVTLQPANDNLTEWDSVFIGPEDTPFAGGVFTLKIHIPDAYPFKPPKVAFVTKVFHPNIYRNGQICLDILTVDKWSPVYSLSAVVQSIQSLLNDPNSSSPANGEAGQLYAQDREAYDKAVRDYVRKWATAPLCK